MLGVSPGTHYGRLSTNTAAKQQNDVRDETIHMLLWCDRGTVRCLVKG